MASPVVVRVVRTTPEVRELIRQGRDERVREAQRITYQRCGGGRRVIRKKIGGD